MFRAPQWHGATQTRLPPRLRKSAWHCDITDVISPGMLCPHTRSNPITRYRQSSRSPATRPRLHQHVSRSPVARSHANALSTKAAQIRMALRHHKRNFATRSAHTLQVINSNHITRYRQSSRSPATRHVYTTCFALSNALPTKTSQIRMALLCAALLESAFAMRRVIGERETCWCKRGRWLVSDKSVLQECPRRVSQKSVPQECPVRVTHKSVLQCLTRVSHQSVRQECPTRVSRESVL